MEDRAGTFAAISPVLDSTHSFIFCLLELEFGSIPVNLRLMVESSTDPAIALVDAPESEGGGEGRLEERKFRVVKLF